MKQLILETTISFLNKIATPILRWAGYEFNYGIDLIQPEDIG